MTSRSSFFKEVRSELRRSLWAPVLSLIGFLFCLPLPCAILIQNYYAEIAGYDLKNTVETDYLETLFESVQSDMATWLGHGNVLVPIGIFIMATLCGVALFRYLHDRRQVDLFHALPVSRTHLFAVRYAAGVAAVLPVYVLLHLVTVAAVEVAGFGAFLSANVVAGTIARNILFFLCLYAVAILCTVLTGNTIITVALGLWVTFFIPAFVGLFTGLENMFYRTFYDPGMTQNQLLLYGSPLLTYFVQCGQDIFGTVEDSAIWSPSTVLAVYTVLTVLLTALCVLLFRIRRSERAGAAMAFEGIKLPVKTVICVILGLAGFVFFHYVINPFWGWFGLVVFLVLGHMVVEVIYHFDFRKAFAHLPHLAVLLVLTVGLVLGMQLDVTGFDRYRPDESEIASVQFRTWNSDYRGGVGNDTGLTDPKVIGDIMALVDDAIYCVNERADYYSGGSQYTNYVDFVVEYELTNGRHVRRAYEFETGDPAIFDRIADVVYSEDFIRTYSELQKLQPETWKPGESSVHIRTAAVPDGGTASGIVFDDAQVAEVIRAMQAAEMTRTVEQCRQEAPVLRIDLRYTPVEERGESWQHNLDYLPVYASDAELLALIREYADVQPVTLTADDVKQIEVTRYRTPHDGETVDYNEPAAMDEKEYDKYVQLGTNEVDTVFLDDPAVIEMLLENGVSNAMESAAPDVFALDPLLIEHADVDDSFSVRIRLGSEWENLYYPAGKAPLDTLRSLFE